jgi:hypothetical protein
VKIFNAILIAVMVTLCGSALLLADTGGQPATQPSTQPANAAGDQFLRYVPDEHGGATLQASIVSYRNPAGQRVDLIAAVHVADQAFYDQLNLRFKQYDSLLYELVKPHDMPISELHDADRPRSWIGNLQIFMKRVLKLKFQLEAINYDAPNFVHADLDVETFTRMEQQRGESITGLMLNAMLQQMMNPQDDDPTGGVGPLLLAMTNPDKARGLKLMLAAQFSKMDDMLAGMEGPDGSVLLTERNKAALRVLRDRLAAGDHRIGIFYGAGHLRGMEKILEDQMGFVQSGPPQWLVAWDMTAPAATSASTGPALAPASAP